MLIQAQGKFRQGKRTWRPTALISCLALILGACSTAPEHPAAADLSTVPPDRLIAAWLGTEMAGQSLRFRFSSEVEVEEGNVERLQGVCGYRSCDSLRMQLLGPMGVTLMDYVNADGSAELLMNKLTDEHDDEARRGLLQILQILTLALVDRCHPLDAFELEHFDDRSADFSMRASDGLDRLYTLDRNSGHLLRQAVSGVGLPSATIVYADYRETAGRWMPGRLEIRTADLPTAIVLEIERWSLGKPFPKGFFDPD